MDTAKPEKKRYYVTTNYSYNVFGANEQLNVFLVYGTRNSFDTINSWSYGTFMKERLASAMAERKIMKLKKVYSAKNL